MLKETEQVPEINALAEMLAGTFVQRSDLYPRQLQDGSFVCIHEPLEHKHLVAHLGSKMTLGAYLLDQESRARFIVLDADSHPQLARLADISNELAQRGVPSYLESSRRGGHLWFFFAQSVYADRARAFGHGVLTLGHANDVELYPKQDRLEDGPGSLIRLPFGIHRKTGLRYGFVTTSGEPLAESLAEQIRILSTPHTVPEAEFERFSMLGQPHVQKPVLMPPDAPGGTLSEEIKSVVTVYDFVSQYVQLSPSGRGRCPFHDDQHASFSVNIEKNYWYCFAGCGGGSLIDFWMKYKKVDFKQAVGELARTLLVKLD